MNRHLGLFLLTALTTTAAGARPLLCLPRRLRGHARRAELGPARARRALVQRPLPRLPDRARVRPLRRRALARAAPVAALLPAGAHPDDRLARRRHRLPRPVPQPPGPLRLRRRRPNRRLRGRGACPGRRARAGRRSSGCPRSSSARGSASRCSSSGWRRPSSARWPTATPSTCIPTALAGWLGLLFTMMNLAPISQLDGGHIAYAVLRRHSRWFTIAGLGTLIYFIVWLGRPLVDPLGGPPLVIMRLVGWEHPQAVDDELPLDPTRLLLARPRRRDPGRLLHPGADVGDRADGRQVAPGHSIVSGSTSTMVRRASAGCCASARSTACRIAVRCPSGDRAPHARSRQPFEPRP